MSNSPLRILFVASEVEGFSKSGGLADVARALPLALKASGHDVRVLTPLYASVPREGLQMRLPQLGVPMGFGEVWCAVQETRLPQSEVPIFFLEHEHFFGRKGYYDEQGWAYPDNAQRFAFLSKAALQLCRALSWTPDVVHCHDWHTALLPYYLKTQAPDLDRTVSVLTLHNAGYQGHFPGALQQVLEVRPEHFHDWAFEDHGSLNLLKGGLTFADRVNAVSPGYAQELQSPPGSHGLHEAILRKQAAFSGILNGCDYGEWNPEQDPHLPANFSAERLAGKLVCKQALQRHFGLPERPEVPVFGLVSRLTEQKGFGMLLPALEEILQWDLQVIAMGSGDSETATRLAQTAQAFPECMGWWEGYSNSLAHQVEAGSDVFLMPSLYEPCGLNQMYSLRYGTLPLVRAVGGLRDTVENYDEASGGGTGFVFFDPTPAALRNTVGWALSTWYDRPKHFQGMISRAMDKRFLWEDAARSYESLYREALNS
ncbi:MAG: glycogen synthase [bacterium]